MLTSVAAISWKVGRASGSGIQVLSINCRRSTGSEDGICGLSWRWTTASTMPWRSSPYLARHGSPLNRSHHKLLARAGLE